MALPQSLTLCIAASLLGGAQASPRDVVNFDFAWRFSLASGENATTLVHPRSGEDLPPEARPEFNDSLWAMVDAPHDMLITGRFDRANRPEQAYLPRGCGWYRKHFTLPSEWRGSVVWLYLEGVFHEVSAWLNGKQLAEHSAGYTSFWWRFDELGDLVQYDDSAEGGENVLAIYVNASSGTGWWYEGGGLSRHYSLVRAPQVFMPPHSSWVWVDMSTASIHPHGPTPADGLYAKNSKIVASTVVHNSGQSSARDVHLLVHFSTGAKALSNSVTLAAGTSANLQVNLTVAEALELWSVGRPYTFTANFSILSSNVAEGATTPWSLRDAEEIRFGARAIRFDADEGFYLNDQRVKLRGFCDHSTFGGVGAAVFDRINLFRAQALRAVGGNAWRMAHNPPLPSRLDIMDVLGMVAIDENRDFGGHQGQGGVTDESIEQELDDMVSMIVRDRSHPSVVMWSLCNERGCKNESSAAVFRSRALLHDATRPITQNNLGQGTHPLSALSLDVQGMSHRSGDVMDRFHKDNPSKPIVSSECCSCMSQRGVDTDFCPKPKQHGGSRKCHDALGQGAEQGVFYNNEISLCTATQVEMSDSRPFNAGTFIWSGFDYLGEAQGWPQVVKCRGTVGDIVGFEKESRWWLRSWWYSNISLSDAGRPVLSLPMRGSHEATVHIAESWIPPSSSPNRTVHVYSSAPVVRLYVNGKVVKEEAPGEFGIATFQIPFEAGNLTAEALQVLPATGQTQSLARHEVHSPGAVASVRLSLDAPSPHTGTGSALVADGEDVALVRAELLDSDGHLVSQGHDSSAKISFQVKSGAGRIIATHNGNPAEQSKPGTTEIAAYHGLARAIVRSSEDSATSAMHRRLLLRIDKDSGKDDSCKVQSPDVDQMMQVPPEPITLEAVVDGVTEVAVLSIPVTRDLEQRPLAVAAATVKQQSASSAGASKLVQI